MTVKLVIESEESRLLRLAFDLIRKKIKDDKLQSRDNFDYLDLDTKQQLSPRKNKICLLIASFKQNYISYGKMMAKKSEEGFPDHTFSYLPLLNIPPMIENSKYKVWDKFVRKTRKFFDCNPYNRSEYINELQKLKNKLSKLSMLYPEKSVEVLFESILEEFEKESGFSNLIEIPKTKTVLTPDQFNEILSEGHPFNDLGASSQHGKWSHRVQIYILGQYLKNNLEDFFDTSDPTWKIQIGMEKNEIFNPKIISTFYRLIGTKEFNNAFVWKEFRENRDQFNKKNNPGKTVNIRFNPSALWPQLFDRMGYTGDFSIPSTFGFLQKLGCFSSLPTLGHPNIYGNQKDKHLKIVMDVTMPLGFSLKNKEKPTSNPLHTPYIGTLFSSQKKAPSSVKKPQEDESEKLLANTINTLCRLFIKKNDVLENEDNSRMSVWYDI
ncbi:MAG: hypothetical protein HYX60_00355 [Legionella longbeachae]|nr:hypothetical protein [Legionella longbeachae]